MSGFYGELILADDERPGEADLDAMDRAMAYWGADGVGRWREGPISLGARLCRITLEDGFDVQPLVEADLVLAGHVRLDDRDGLIRGLGLAGPASVDLPDSRLFALAWRRWGEACADRILGDWVCAVWDRTRHRLWLGRDAAGNTGLYYWHDRRRLVFATSLKALLAHPAVPRRPDAYAVARQLAVVQDHAEASATVYAGIRRLPGGHALRCGQDVQDYAWWRPEALAEYDWPQASDYYQAFRELYGQAVRDRLRRADGPVALMFSAGLDSGSVAALAAPMLAGQGQALRAYVAVPHYPPDGAGRRRLGDEGPLARAAAEHIGHIDLSLSAAPGAGLVASLARMIGIHDRPLHAVANQYWLHDILGRARRDGARVLLTGQGGNATVSWSGTGNLWPLLRAGRVDATLAALWAGETGLWSGIREGLLKPVLSPLRGRVARLGPTRLGLTRLGQPPWAGYSAIHPRLAAEVDLIGRMGRAGHDPGFAGPVDSRHPDAAGFRLGRTSSASLGALWMELAAAHGLDVRDPTRDRRLIEFCWRVPDRIHWAGGVRRGLIRKGMPDALPPDVLHGRGKGLQAADIGHRVLAEQAAISVLLDRLEGHALAAAWLDLAKMRAVLAELGRGVTPAASHRAGAILLRGLAVGMFLERF